MKDVDRMEYRGAKKKREEVTSGQLLKDLQRIRTLLVATSQ